MLCHTALQPDFAATVLSRTQPGITPHLPAILKPEPVPDLSINHYPTQSAKAAWLARTGCRLQLLCQGSDLLLQSNQDRLTVTEAALSSMQALAAKQKCAASTSWSSAQTRD